MKHVIPRFVRLLAFPLFACSFATLHAADAPKPNILLITADDLGLQLSCYGDKHIQTPHLDALAASGVRFETAYIAQSSCSPSRASIFTGMFPHSHGHIGLAKPKNPPLHAQLHSQTIPALLKAAGYRTGIIGKLHVNPASAFPFDFKVNNDQIGEGGSRNAKGVARQTAKFLAQDPKRPFFLMVSNIDPHREFVRQLDGLPKKPFQKGDVPEWPFQEVRDDQVLTDAADYYNCVRRLDTCVGLVLAELKKAGAEQDTLVIFLSDNGPPLARGKTTCYEAGLRTPFLLRWPGVTKTGLFSKAFVSSVDILPTILDAIGLPVPAQVQGRSLRGVAGGDNTGWRTTLAGEFHQHGERPFFPRRSLRDSRYHVIHNLLAGKLTINIAVDGDTAPQVAASAAYNDTPAQQAMALAANPPEWELYDLQTDPAEFQNLADDPAHAGTLKRMQDLLHDWRKETQDPFLDPDLLAKRHRDVNTASDAPDAKAPSRKKHGLLTGEPTLQAPVSGGEFVPAADGGSGKKVYYPQAPPAKESALKCFSDWPEGTSPAGVGKRVAQNFLPRGHYQDHPLLRYPDSIVWFGALKVARETGDNELAGELIRRFDRYRANPKLVPDKFHVDYAVLGIVPLELYRLTKDPALRKLGMHRADGQWLNPTADGVTAQARYWVDDIYMIAAIQTAAYRVTNDPAYLDRAALTTATYLKRLQKDDGLFWHAEDSPFVWGRGVGWYAAGMTEILKCLPATHPNFPAIMGGYKKMMAALLEHQAPSGLWRQLVDKAETWEETSGSGMFAYAMVTGVRRGWLDQETYGAAARKAWLALVDQIDAGGNLQQVCVGTNKGAKEVGTALEKQYRFYLDRPRVAGDYHGQAPLLWTAAALLEQEAD